MRQTSTLAAFLLVFGNSVFAQINMIDRSKLPQGDAVQQVYTDLLPINSFARTFEANWRFSTPQAQVVARFSSEFRALMVEQKKNPNNTELQLFTGLVAHLAYNLDLQEAYTPAMTILQARAQDDFRAAWFLAAQQCQSNDIGGGMRRFLQTENSSAHLPDEFWQDYANCASVADMPEHAVRAYDNARKASYELPMDEQLEKIARDRIKPSSLTSSDAAKQAWHAENASDQVRFTSELCGESFATRPTFHININDPAKATCTVTIETERYPTRQGASSATLLLWTQAAQQGESLEAYSQRMLSDPRYAERKPLSGVLCPVKTCIVFEIVTDKLYKAEGGAHLIALFYQSQPPDYPGLRFEMPRSLPTTDDKPGQPTFYRPELTLQRYGGVLYTFIALDANQDIYPRSRRDFDHLMKSLIVDSEQILDPK